MTGRLRVESEFPPAGDDEEEDDDELDLDGEDFDDDDNLTPFLLCLTAPLNRKQRRKWMEAVDRADIDELWALWEALKAKVEEEWEEVIDGGKEIEAARNAVEEVRED